MFWKSMKLGAFGEIYRFQVSSFFKLILYTCIFILIGIVNFLFNPLVLTLWVVSAVTLAILLVLFSKVLLIYEDGFKVDNLLNHTKSQLRLDFKEMIDAYVHLDGFRGSNYFTFYYKNDNIDMKVSFRVGDVDKTIKPIQFLIEKGVIIYVDDEKFGEGIFGISRDKFIRKNKDAKNWFTVPDHM